MLGIGIPEIFVHWVMEYVSSVSYSIVLNGRPEKPFVAKKGIRQGDPLPPFLFAKAMDYLSRLLAEFPKTPSFKFHHRCSKNKITHLLFSDDLLLFSCGHMNSISAMMNCFQKFSMCSRLSANLDKSEVFFSGVSTESQ